MKKKTKTHEALDIFCPIHFKPNRVFLFLKDDFKSIQRGLMALYCLVLTLFVVSLFSDTPSIVSNVLGGLFAIVWVSLSWMDYQKKRYHKQINTISDLTSSYTGIKFNPSDLEESILKVYLLFTSEQILSLDNE